MVDGSAAAQAGFALLGFSLVFQIFLSGLLNQLLGMIDNLTVITHLFLISISVPSNISQFLNTLFPLITLDYLQINLLNEEIFGFTELENWALSYQFEAIGYSQTFLVVTLADKFYFILFGPAFIFFVYVMHRITSYFKLRRLNAYFEGQYTGIIWNGIIGFFAANYMCLVIAALIQLEDIRVGKGALW